MLALDSGHTVGNIAAPVLVQADWLLSGQTVVWPCPQEGPPGEQTPIDSVGPGLHAPFPHQAGHTVFSHSHTLAFQGLVNLWAAISAFTITKDPAYLQQQIGILYRSFARLSVGPSVVPGA